METLFHYVAPPGPCNYLPDQVASLEYEMVADLSAADYLQRMLDGWRRFGGMLFRPRCPACTQCRALRVLVDRFHPNRSQRRAWALNEKDVEVRIGLPSVTRPKLTLYDRYHAFQTWAKEWPFHYPKDAASYKESFVNNPPFTEEWCYVLDGRLAGVGYVDNLPGAMSAIYFFYDPDLRGRSLGTYNVMRVLAEAKARGLEHVYLGYYVAGCRSLEYKANFKPNEMRWPDGAWRDFLS